ncbi:MAG: hypothetical protein ACUVSM_13695, partial [Armatimonadota bacterium]
IDEVTVKPISALTRREVEKENPEFRQMEDVCSLLSRIYDRPVTPLDTVIVVLFSRVAYYTSAFVFQEHSKGRPQTRPAFS